MDEIITLLNNLSGADKVIFNIAGITLLLFIFAMGSFIGILTTKVRYLKALKDERNDAVKRSRAVIGGQVSEQLAPLFPDFPARYDEVKFLGKPIDYIAFKGLEESDENRKCHVDEILFIEVKTGTSALSEREKAIKEAVEAGRVSYTVWRK